MNNRFILFNLVSNQYTSFEIDKLFERDTVVVIKPSPYDDNIVACGSKRGLVTIVHVIDKVILHRLRGHDAVITCLDWMQLTIDTPVAGKPVSSRENKSPIAESENRPKAIATSKEIRLRGQPTPIVDPDDAFDIYDFDDGADEFGVISRATYATVEDNKRDAAKSNENFNYVEACQNLMEDILQGPQIAEAVDVEANHKLSIASNMDDSLIASDFEKLSMSATDLESVKQPNADVSNELSTTIALGNSSDESFVHVEESPKAVAKKVTFLASGATDANIWMWNADTGSAVHKIQLKKVKNTGLNCNIFVVSTNDDF